MGKQLKVLALVFGTMLSFSAMSQKIGHINADSLLQMMPETMEAQKQLEAYGSQLEKDLGEMENELQAKIEKFRKDQNMYTELTKQTKTQEIQELQMRIQDYSQKAQQDLQEKQVELLTPIIEKATNAVKDVAKEEGYTYILDSSPSKAVVIFKENGNNIMPKVKAKLGIQ